MKSKKPSRWSRERKVEDGKMLCVRCGSKKAVAEFYRLNDSWCIPCRRAYAKALAQKRRDENALWCKQAAAGLV